MSKFVIIYGTGSHNTERMAIAIEEGARKEGVETLLKNVNDAGTIDLKDADAVAIGSPNYRDAMMPTVEKFLHNLKDIDLAGKIGLSFGSYGWGLEAVEGIQVMLENYGMEMENCLSIKRMPGEEELEKCRDVGTRIASRLRSKPSIEC